MDERPIFWEYPKLSEDQKKKGRRLLRTFLDRKYFGNACIMRDGDLSPTLVHIVAIYMDKYDLPRQCQRMFQWVDANKKGEKAFEKKNLILRFNKWIEHLKKFENERLSKEIDADEENVKEFIRKRNAQKKHR